MLDLIIGSFCFLPLFKMGSEMKKASKDDSSDYYVDKYRKTYRPRDRNGRILRKEDGSLEDLR